VKSYWEPSFEVLSNDDQVIRGEQFGYLLSESVKRITSCEVPYGLYLSKGVDSQVINALGSFDKTYYFDRDEDWGEDFYKNFSKISQILDFPVGSLSSYPLYKLAERASLSGVKVVVSGEGSDEILGGYVRYLPISSLDDVYNNFPSYQRLFNKALGSRELQFAKISCRNDDVDFVMHLIEECRAKTSDMLTCMQYFDFKYVLPSLLQMGDRMASNFSLENRCPFLDKDLIEYAFSLPKIDKINQHNQKAILRNMAHRLGVKTEKEKTGLTIKFNVYMHRNDWNRDNYFSNLNYEWLLGVRS
jgi:asparagine synthase (glutamine-hydrolysing)